MKKIFLISILFLFAYQIALSQNTVIHDIFWHSDTVGVWGSGSSAWSINQVDTLADVTVGPYSDQFSMIYNIPFPISDSVGVIFDYGAYTDLQLIFAMTGWDNGAAKVNYPTKITMELPADGVLSNGAWETIPSDYRVHDSLLHPSDANNWSFYADWPDAGIIHLFLNMDVEAHADLIYSDPTDPLNITWDTLHVFDPIDIHLDTFDIFLIDMINNEYAIPWVDYHTDPITGSTVIDSVYILQDSLGWPLVFPPIFYDLIGISGDISIPNIQNYTEWTEDEQRLYAWGNDEYMHINLDIVQFLQVTTDYLSNIPSMEGLAAVSQALQYEEGDTSIYIFTDPVSGEDFTADLTWDLIDAELMFTNTMNQTLSFVDNQEYSFFGIPIGPDHYPNVWNVLEFPLDIEYNIYDTTGSIVESGESDSVKYCADYDLELRLPCNDLDSLPLTISHSIDPWFTNMVRDSIDVEFYLKVLDLTYSIGTTSNPVLDGNFLLYENTFDLGTLAGPPLFGPPIFMPWMINGYFVDTTFIPDEYIIPQNDPLRDSINFTNVLCYGTASGSIWATGIGGTLPYSYLWEDEMGNLISSNNSLTNLETGTYFLTITDGNDCEFVDSVSIVNTNSQILLTETINNVLCFGDSTGSVTINVTGGTPPYQYIWQPNNETSQSITNLPSGTYYLTVTDNIGCETYDSIAIVDINPAVGITTQQTNNVSCFGGNDGLIDIEVYGGLPPFSYIWTNNTASQDNINITAGNYSVTVSDNNGCTEEESWAITQPEDIFITTNLIQNISCNGNSDGEIEISVSGGTVPYTYYWETVNGSGLMIHQEDQNNLTPGSYYLTITDENGCDKSANWTLTEPEPLIIITDSTKNINCFGGNDGIVHVTAQGGTSPYNYSWQTNDGNGIIQNTDNQNTLTIGTYTLTVNDSEGCLASASWTLQEPEILSIISEIEHIKCHGENNGEIYAEGSGGIAPYSYTWSTNTGSTLPAGQEQNNLSAGSYFLTLTDENLCSIINELIIIEPNALTIGTIDNLLICKGDTVNINMSTTGGVAPYTYYWNNISLGQTISISTTTDTNLVAIAKDMNGCYSNVEHFEINIMPGVELYLSDDSVDVCENKNITINTSVVGGVEPYTYTDQYGTILSDPIIYSPNQTGTYSITVQDACKTTSSKNLYVQIYPLPNINISADDTKGCEPFDVNFLNNTIETGVNYIWDFGDNTNYSNLINPSHVYNKPGIYRVNLTALSDKGCQSSDYFSQNIYVWGKPNANFYYLPSNPSFLNPNVEFDNQSDGASSYIWAFGDGAISEDTNPNHKYQTPNSYHVKLTAISSYGCFDSITKTLVVKEKYTFFAPNAFSPDDDLKNDSFYVLGSGIKEENFLLIVYDRWGEPIWQTDLFDKRLQKSDKWNGFAKNKKRAQNGAYTWVVQYQDVNGRNHEKTGVVILLR